MRHRHRLGILLGVAAVQLTAACTSDGGKPQASPNPPATAAATTTATTAAATAPGVPTPSATVAPSLALATPTNRVILSQSGHGDQNLGFTVGLTKTTIQVSCAGPKTFEIQLFHIGGTTPDRDIRMGCDQLWATTFALPASSVHDLSLHLITNGNLAWNALVSEVPSP